MQKIPCRFCACGKNDEKELIGASRRLCRSLRLGVPDLPADEETLCSGCSAPERPADWAPCPDEAQVYRDGKADCSLGGPELGADDLFVAWCCPVDGAVLTGGIPLAVFIPILPVPLSFASFLTQALPIGGVADTAQNIVDRWFRRRAGQSRDYGSQDKRTGASEKLSA